MDLILIGELFLLNITTYIYLIMLPLCLCFFSLFKINLLNESSI